MIVVGLAALAYQRDEARHMVRDDGASGVVGIAGIAGIVMLVGRARGHQAKGVDADKKVEQVDTADVVWR